MLQSTSQAVRLFMSFFVNVFCVPCCHKFRTDHSSMILTTDSMLPFLASSMKGKYMVWISSVNGNVMYWNNTCQWRWKVLSDLYGQPWWKRQWVNWLSVTINNSFLKKIIKKTQRTSSSCIYKNTDYFWVDCGREHQKLLRGIFYFIFFPNPRVVFSQSQLMEYKLPYHTWRRQCNEKKVRLLIVLYIM